MKKLLLCAAIWLPALSWAGDACVDIAHFSRGDLNGWQHKSFVGETHYTFLENSHGQLALRADSNAAASGRYREVSVDLNKTPIL